MQQCPSDAATLGYILRHGEATVLLVDTEFSDVAREAVQLSERTLLIIDIEDTEGPVVRVSARSPMRPSLPKALQIFPTPCPTMSGMRCH
jgi:hypothetical protein